MTTGTGERSSPDACLVGGHWDTYVLVGLQYHHPLHPVVEGAWQRMPWELDCLHQGKPVVVGYKTATPPVSLSPEGESLRFESELPVRYGETRYARYRNDRRSGRE